MSKEKVLSHFKARAATYNQSSRWCTDADLLQKIRSILSPGEGSVILDMACGTGMVGQVFRGKVKAVVGVDITEEMYRQGQKHMDLLVHAPGERLPFRNGIFDFCMERQGLQFMDAPAALAEMARVTRPGGKICLVQLCAYGAEDRDEYFKILALRNPARRNFFLREDLKKLLEGAGCSGVKVQDFISEENVNVWADNGAISKKNQDEIQAVYKNASVAFARHHAVKTDSAGHVIDRMLFGIAVGTV